MTTATLAATSTTLTADEDKALNTLFPPVAPIAYKHLGHDTITLWASDVDELRDASDWMKNPYRDVYQVALFFVPSTREFVIARAKPETVHILPAVARFGGGLAHKTEVVTSPERAPWASPRSVVVFRSSNIVDLLEGAEAMRIIATVIIKGLMKKGGIKGHVSQDRRTGIAKRISLTLYGKNFNTLAYIDYSARVHSKDEISLKQLKKAAARFR